MSDEEFKEWAKGRLAYHLKQLGWKTQEEIDQENLEGMIRRYSAPLEERAKDLRAAGISIRHICVCLQKSRNTVHRMLNPEAKAKHRDYMREYMRAYRARKKAE